MDSLTRLPFPDETRLSSRRKKGLTKNLLIISTGYESRSRLQVLGQG